MLRPCLPPTAPSLCSPAPAQLPICLPPYSSLPPTLWEDGAFPFSVCHRPSFWEDIAVPSFLAYSSPCPLPLTHTFTACPYILDWRGTTLPSTHTPTSFPSCLGLGPRSWEEDVGDLVPCLCAVYSCHLVPFAAEIYPSSLCLPLPPALPPHTPQTTTTPFACSTCSLPQWGLHLCLPPSMSHPY